MEKITEYKVLSADTPAKLTDAVNNYIVRGWTVSGSIAVNTYSVNGVIAAIYIQPVVKV